MGSRLALLAAVQLIAAVVLAGDAAADTRSRELYKRGIEEYKAQRYSEAVATLKESYELEPKPDTLFALAQAERLAGRCPEARVHYRKLLESTTEIAAAKAVQSNLDLCGPEPDRPAAQRGTEPERPRAEPSAGTSAGTSTTARAGRRTDKIATALLAGGTLGVGVGGGLLLASMNNRDDARSALTLEDNQRLNDRADTQRLVSLVAIGAGAAMIGVAVARWVMAGEAKPTEPKTGLGLAPSAGGAMLVLSSGW